MEWRGSALGHLIWHYASYHIQRAQLLASFSHRLLVLACISFTCVTSGALLYYAVSGQPLTACLLKSYGVMFRAPGFVVSNEPTLAAALALNTMFIFSVFVFATLIGMIGDEVKQSVHALRNGDVPLRLSGHTLVLNWNSLTLSLLRQLYHAQHDPKHCLYKRPVVVLADRPKSEMDAVVFNAMKGLKFEVFLRSGRPSRQPDLQRVAAHAAGAVLLLQPEPCSSDAAAEALKATTLVSLRCLQLTEAPASWSFNTTFSPRHWARSTSTKTAWQQLAGLVQGCSSSHAGHHPGSSRATVMPEDLPSVGEPAMRVVVQVTHMPRPDDLLGFLHSTTACVSKIEGARLLSQRMLDRFVAQTAVQPGVGQAFREIVRAGADAAQLCWCEVDEPMQGSRYRQARQMFPHAVVLGVLSATDGKLTLNPADDLKLAAGDRLLGFTREAKMQPTFLGSSSSSSSSGGWRNLRKTISRASSMTSNNLHIVSSSSSITSLERDSTPRYLPLRAVKVIILGWRDTAVEQLLSSLQETAPEGSCFTVLHQTNEQQLKAQHGSSSRLAEMQSRQASQLLQDGAVPEQQQPVQQGSDQEEQQQQQQQRYTVRHLYMGEPPGCTVAQLTAAGIADADAVIIGPALAPSRGYHTACAAAGGLECNCESDAMVVAALLAVQQSLQQTAATAQVATFTGPSHNSMDTSKVSRISKSKAGNTNSSRNANNAGITSSSESTSWRHTSATRLHVVAVLSSYSVRRAAQVFLGSLLQCHFSYEIMVLDEYAAAMLLQVAQDPATSLVMNQLLVAQPSGKGLFMWPATELELKYGSSVSFSQICKAARRQNSTALGYRRANGSMLLAPFTDEVFALEEGDRIVVIANS